jgi:hypothetical protein
MVRKTRKNAHHKKGKDKGVQSIPELRRSFEHIERLVDSGLGNKESHEKVARDLRREWKKTFYKDLDKKSAELFVANRMKQTKGQRRTTMKHKGGAAAISGAPLDYTTRQGVYLAPGQIPDKAGHLPLTGDKPSKFGNYLEYVSKGFSVGIPEIAQNYDPVPGQTSWPKVPADMGSNAVHFAQQKGGRRSSKRVSRRKLRKGGGLLGDRLESAGAMLSQAFSRPVQAAAPPSLVQDLQSKWYGTQVGPSPDQVQRHPSYQLGSVYPKAVTLQ